MDRAAMTSRVERPGVRAGYDAWSESYDRTANPLVALDRRHTLALLRPAAGERILDAGCGTGSNLRALLRMGSRPLGLDFSRGMLAIARRTLGDVPLVEADLVESLPVRSGAFDAVLCALVGEHLEAPARFFGRAHEALQPEGRFVFSVFHPELAAAGIEANFERAGVEYRLGAHRHSVNDYLTAIEEAGFRHATAHEFPVDTTLAGDIPAARKYLGQPLLLAIEATRA
jgi:SAM-dependent methyltransferase